MPRPKVRPEDRRRSTRACLSCKTSKIRCDALQPCGSCRRRGQASHCTYSGIDRRRRQRLDDSEYSEFDVVGDVLTSGENAGVSLPSPFSVEMSGSNQSQRGISNGVAREKVYVGETSSQSFLHFLRKTVKAYVGCVSFTDGERQYVTLDADLSVAARDVRLDTSLNNLQSLVDSYLEATSGILDLFTKEELTSVIRERTSEQETTFRTPMKDDNATALDLALAIGAQARGQADDLPLGKAYFSRARTIAIENMFVSQTPDSIRIFLLVAFYMLGACNRSGAAMFLGVASKGAMMLGLPGTLNQEDDQRGEIGNRMRIWHSIQNVNVLCTFILGRPNDLPMDRDNAGKMALAESAFDAMVRVCTSLEEIVDAQRKSSGLLHVPSAEVQLQSLRQWSRGLPSYLRLFTTPFTPERSCTPISASDKQALMGGMHLSCVYYFAVILITRPFLVAYLMSRLRGRAPDHLISDPDQASDINIKNNKVSRLAQVCVSSASYMVDMCVRAKAAGFMFGNLCLLKAWVFAAGLVLGFSMFAGEPRQDINESFNSACMILAEIASTSPQAQLYHSILTSFAEAVDVYRQRVEDERRRTVQHYMDQILVIDAASVSQREGRNESVLDHERENRSSGGMSSTNTILPSDGDAEADDELTTLLRLTSGFPDQGWNEVDMQLLDYPVPELEPFDQFFYTVE
ncbi:hypothetical protein BJX70DRAFT_395493 [Aspergillus crustosus]